MEKIIQFFNFSLPCPPEIKDCEQLRQQYKADLEVATKAGGCPPCIERNVRNTYTLRIQELLK